MLSAILAVIIFIAFIKISVKITWTILKALCTLIVYGILFVLITSVFGFVWLSPILFLAGAAWLIGRSFMLIF